MVLKNIYGKVRCVFGFFEIIGEFRPRKRSLRSRQKRRDPLSCIPWSFLFLLFLLHSCEAVILPSRTTQWHTASLPIFPTRIMCELQKMNFEFSIVTAFGDILYVRAVNIRSNIYILYFKKHAQEVMDIFPQRNRSKNAK